MPLTIETVRAKARAFVDGLVKGPHNLRGTVPHGQLGNDYIVLLAMARRVAPDRDDRLLGPPVDVYSTFGGDRCHATFAKIEVFARQIEERLAVLLRPPAGGHPVAAAQARPHRTGRSSRWG